jgi:glycine hydroxymethyltransferase
MIMCKAEHAKAIDKAVFPGLQGGPHENNIAAKAIAFKEALEPEFKDYAKQIKLNAKALEKKFNEFEYKLMFGGTDNHLLLMDVTPKGVSGKEAQYALDAAGITVNKNMIPDDPRSPMDPSGIRLGTPALTTRGMKEAEMEIIAGLIDRVITHHTDETVLKQVRTEVEALTARFPLYPELVA